METNDLLQRFNIQNDNFNGRVNMLYDEYDNLLSDVPEDLSECCTLEAAPEPELIHVTLIFHEDIELPPIVKQRILEIFHELFPDGRYV